MKKRNICVSIDFTDKNDIIEVLNKLKEYNYGNLKFNDNYSYRIDIK